MDPVFTIKSASVRTEVGNSIGELRPDKRLGLSRGSWTQIMEIATCKRLDMIVNSSANLRMINVCDEEKGILKDEDMGNKKQLRGRWQRPPTRNWEGSSWPWETEFCQRVFFAVFRSVWHNENFVVAVAHLDFLFHTFLEHSLVAELLTHRNCKCNYLR